MLGGAISHWSIRRNDVLFLFQPCNIYQASHGVALLVTFFACSYADVVVNSQGLWSHLLVGVMEQTFIYDVIHCELDDASKCLVVHNSLRDTESSIALTHGQNQYLDESYS